MRVTLESPITGTLKKISEISHACSINSFQNFKSHIDWSSHTLSGNNKSHIDWSSHTLSGNNKSHIDQSSHTLSDNKFNNK
jgi:hypothetical protein